MAVALPTATRVVTRDLARHAVMHAGYSKRHARRRLRELADRRTRTERIARIYWQAIRFTEQHGQPEHTTGPLPPEGIDLHTYGVRWAYAVQVRVRGAWREVARFDEEKQARAFAAAVYAVAVDGEGGRIRIHEVPVDGLSDAQRATLRMIVELGGRVSLGPLTGEHQHKYSIRCPWGLTYFYASTLAALERRGLIVRTLTDAGLVERVAATAAGWAVAHLGHEPAD